MPAKKKEEKSYMLKRLPAMKADYNKFPNIV